MASRLRLVWSSSSPTRRAPGCAPLRAGSPPSRATALAQELVDSWLEAPIDSGAAARDDLVDRIAAALEGHARIILPVTDVAAAERGPGAR